MKKTKLLKRIISVCLCFILSFSTSLVAFAETSADDSVKLQNNAKVVDENGAVTPVVLVPGVGSSALYLNPNTKEQSGAIEVDSSLVKKAFKTGVVKGLFGAMFGKDVDTSKFIDGLAELIEPFIAFGCNDDGISTENIGIDCYWEDSLTNHLDYLETRTSAEPAMCKQLCDSVGADNVYIFNYDFRLDVVDDADKLSEFIDNVKEQKGCDKVTLVSGSLGTCVVSAYIDRHMDKNDIAKSIFVDGAFQGVTIANMFKKDLVIDKEICFDYMESLQQCYPADTVDFGQILGVFDKFDGTVDNLMVFLNDLTKNHIDELYSKVLLPIVGNMPALWECIPYDNFDQSVKTAIELGFLSEDSVLYEKIQTYHQIQGRLQQNLETEKAKGVQLAVVCNYGMPTLPMTSSYALQSDMLIDTVYSSAGATVADFGTTLDATGDFVSADKEIDTSTAMLPESTWCLKYVQHMDFIYGNDNCKFLAYLASTNVNLNKTEVLADGGYAQFMSVDKDHNMTNIEAE